MSEPKDLVTFRNRLATYRDSYDKWSEKKASAMDALNRATERLPELEEVRNCENRLRVLGEALERTDRALRACALGEYQATGATAPVEGVTIKKYKTLKYEKLAATVWCRTAAPGLLDLNVKRFEAAALALECPHVKEVEEPKVFIASDLSAFVEK